MWFGAAIVSVAAEETSPPPDKTPSIRDLTNIRKAVESLRGKKFLRPVPSFNISRQELEKIVDREVDKDYPGAELPEYQELLAWVGAVPPGTDLKTAYKDFLIDQVAGMYDSDTKEMLIPRFPSGQKTSGKKPAQKKLEKLADFDSSIVFAHEFTHALEDQYWDLDDPAAKNSQASTDIANGHSFLAEGSATRLMVEAIPSVSDYDSPSGYVFLWNLIHSGMAETVLDFAMADIWKTDDVKVEGVPDSVCRMEAMPYSYGYTFCSRIMRDWGLDGLDYIYDHRPISSEQVMHPVKCWEWRDYPVQITLPETVAEGWRRKGSDSAGEAGIAAFFSSDGSFARSEMIAKGWDGDRMAMYQLPNGHRVLVWASAWDSALGAQNFARAFAKERRKAAHAQIKRTPDGGWTWQRPDGRCGKAIINNHYVVLLETDLPETLANPAPVIQAIAFTEPPQDAERARQQHAWLHYNPLFSWRKDGGYTVSKTLCGLVSRHDRNEVGAADRFFLGLGTTRRTKSFNKWELGWGALAAHQSEARRDTTKTTILPFGLLVSHFATALPQTPEVHIGRSSILWGLGASHTWSSPGSDTFNLLPFGTLFHRVNGPDSNSFHILATGYSHDNLRGSTQTRRVRVLGFPIWTNHGPASNTAK